MGSNTNPLLAGLPWANGTNYPSGSYGWSGQPIKVTPAYSYFTPSPQFAPSAEEFNALLNQRDLALLDLYGRIGQLDGTNFGPPTAQSQTLTGIVWSAFGGYWLALNASGIDNTVYCSVDGRSWSTNGGGATLGHPPLSIAVRASDGVAIACTATSGSGQVYVLAPDTPGWTANAGPGYSVSGFWPVSATVYDGSFVVATSNGHFYTSTNGSTWTTGTGTPPTFTSGLFVQGNGKLLFLSVGGTTYSYSSDGATWTAGTMPTLLTNEKITGATFDDVVGVFIMTVGTTGTTRVFISSNGTTWTVLGKTFARGWLPSYPGASQIVANGNEWLLVLPLPSNNGNLRPVLSIDGGASWGLVPLLLNSASDECGVFTNGQQYLASDALPSTSVSLLIGVPAVSADY